MGFKTSTDVIEPTVEEHEMEIDTPLPSQTGRPNASVSLNDTAIPSGESTKSRPAPSTLDLTLQSSNPIIEHIPSATITTPNPTLIPHMADATGPLPKIPSEKGMNQAAESAPLQAGSLIGHPAVRGDGSGKRPRSDSIEGKQVGKKAVVPEQALMGDDDDEPLPEMDSDMDLSDEDGEDEDDDEE
jgi:hypothetical protein